MPLLFLCSLLLLPHSRLLQQLCNKSFQSWARRAGSGAAWRRRSECCAGRATCTCAASTSSLTTCSMVRRWRTRRWHRQTTASRRRGRARATTTSGSWYGLRRWPGPARCLVGRRRRRCARAKAWPSEGSTRTSRVSASMTTSRSGRAWRSRGGAGAV